MGSAAAIRFFFVVLIGAAAALIYMTAHPKMTVTPVPAINSNAAFGTLFSLKNLGISGFYDLNSSYCLNSFNASDGSQPPPGILRLDAPSLGVSLAPLGRDDAEALPIDNAPAAPPGSQVDLVFIVKFQPGGWIDPIERRFRFAGTENQDKTWSWRQMPLGSPCG